MQSATLLPLLMHLDPVNVHLAVSIYAHEPFRLMWHVGSHTESTHFTFDAEVLTALLTV